MSICHLMSKTLHQIGPNFRGCWVDAGMVFLPIMELPPWGYLGGGALLFMFVFLVLYPEPIFFATNRIFGHDNPLGGITFQPALDLTRTMPATSTS